MIHLTWADAWPVIKKMTKTHYACHIHGNNFGRVHEHEGVLVPEVFEMTYLRKCEFPERPPFNKHPFPRKIDCKNNPQNDELRLRGFPYVAK